MSEKEKNEKKGFLDRPTTRRDFLKMSCKGIVGTALSVSFLSLFTDSADASGFALATGVVIADPNRCTGCRRCEVVCTVTNDGKVSPHIARIKVGRNYNFGQSGPKLVYQKEDGEYGNMRIVPDTCRQCAEPDCAIECPMGAIDADPKTGARVVDTDLCVGCGYCTEACPWSMPTVDPETKKSTKCVLCNGQPTCASNCPTGAIKFVPWSEVATLIRRRNLFGA